MPRVTRSTEDIVIELIEKSITIDECWICHLAPIPSGRHYVDVGGRSGKKWRVTRLIWTIYNGPIAEGLQVCHKCDNPACIKPEHLFLGTAQDNTNDMISKGRKVDDPEVGARRRAETAARIYKLLKQGLSPNEITTKLRISASTLWNYTNGPYRDSITILARD